MEFDPVVVAKQRQQKGVAKVVAGRDIRPMSTLANMTPRLIGTGPGNRDETPHERTRIDTARRRRETREVTPLKALISDHAWTRGQKSQPT